jgi:hypothetical protein
MSQEPIVETIAADALWPDAPEGDLVGVSSAADVFEKPSVWRPFGDALVALPPVEWMVDGFRWIGGGLEDG